MIVGDIPILFLPTDKISRQKQKRQTLELNDIINEMRRVDIYRIFHKNTKMLLLISSWLILY